MLPNWTIALSPFRRVLLPPKDRGFKHALKPTNGLRKKYTTVLECHETVNDLSSHRHNGIDIRILRLDGVHQLPHLRERYIFPGS